MVLFFFFNDTPTTEIYTLSLHDALPIWRGADLVHPACRHQPAGPGAASGMDLRHAHHDGDLVGPLLLHQRSYRQGPLLQAAEIQLRSAAHVSGLAHVGGLHRAALHSVLLHHSGAGWRHVAVLEP